MTIKQYRSAIPRSQGVLVLGSSGAAASISTGTSEVALATITIPANTLGLTGRLRITSLWSHTNSGNNKTMRVRLGGLSGTALQGFVVTTTATSQNITFISANGATNAQKSYTIGTTVYGSSANALGTAAIDMTASTTLVLTGQPASNGETVTLEAYTVELIPGV